MRFGDASADFLFKSTVTSITLSKESGDDEGGSGTGSEGTEGVDFAVTGEEERLETVERVRKKSRNSMSQRIGHRLNSL